MRLGLAGWIALIAATGCVRIGYDPRRHTITLVEDAGAPHDAAAQRDAGGVQPEPGGSAAGMGQGGGAGGSVDPTPSSGTGASGEQAGAAGTAGSAGAGVDWDASTASDAGSLDAAVVQTEADGGGQASGMGDAATADAAVASGDCGFSIGTNTYDGSPHYHGTLLLLNTGSTTWTTPTISFDLPSTTYVCNDAKSLPGKDWTLVTNGNHCEYTRLSQTPAIAPGAILTFDYSTNNPETLSIAPVINLSVTGCQ